MSSVLTKINKERSKEIKQSENKTNKQTSQN